MAGHIVAPFGGVLVVRVIFGGDFFKIMVKVGAGGGIGVLVND